MNCLICYKPLIKDEIDYHSNCISTLFGIDQLPIFDIDEKELEQYAKKIIGANKGITGVQPKLSLWLEKNKNNVRYTFVENTSNYIIKPQSKAYLSLPENEDLCMHMANEVGIEVAKHGLIRLKSGSIAYITKRFDRDNNIKIATEDLCQLSENLTEHKYRGSYEKMGKTISKHSSQSGLDSLHYFQLVLFSFIIGNADMHLKNFSMMEKDNGVFCLSPAYDILSTKLVIPDENEQMALNINGKKNKVSKKDFNLLGESLNLTQKQVVTCYDAMIENQNKMDWWIDHSFIPFEQKNNLKELINQRLNVFIPLLISN